MLKVHTNNPNLQKYADRLTAALNKKYEMLIHRLEEAAVDYEMSKLFPDVPIRHPDLHQLIANFDLATPERNRLNIDDWLHT